MNKECFQNSIKKGQFKIIGHGSFGKVILCQNAVNKKNYAIKILNLKQCSETQLKIIQRQIEIHSSVEHQNIIKLEHTYLESNVIHMVMEFAQKGNLFYYQNTKNRFTEKEAHKYFIESCKAIDYLHRNNILHRDLKPQNLLLDKKYNIKLCDFGWSAKDIHQARKTFCGTYQYMAPQMILKKSYDYRVDIWSLGILLYQLVHGNAPFKGTNLQEISTNIQFGQYELGSWLSNQLKTLIKSLLKSNAQRRISMSQIFAHSWVKKFQINEISRRVESEPAVISSLIEEIKKNKERRKNQGKHKQLKSFNELKELSSTFFQINPDFKIEVLDSIEKTKSKKKFNIRLNTISSQKLKSINKDMLKSLGRVKSEEGLFKSNKVQLKYKVQKNLQSGVRLKTNPNLRKIRKEGKMGKKRMGLN